MSWLKMREPVNTWTHFVTFLAGIVGLVFLILLAVEESPSKVTTMTIYGVTLIVLFGASSLYHWVRVKPKAQLVFRKIDHISIFLFIAGSYTPLFFHGLEGPWRWTMLSAVWAIAVVGIVLKIWFMNAPRWVSTLFYITLGWVAVVPFAQLIDTLPTNALVLMIVGGVAYTVGGIIYATKIFDFFPNKFGFHEIFHLFVMAGALAHFFMMFLFIMPM
ncbi:PAQR family membrane homeostasis protein TrhA [Bacillus fonticola]|uniref:PAQR family membrane homeostasis protein TrhA n=1 Tax=Bacillus fonticola TaxID=2728853 RepID=UPI0014764B48|nr:hemolysin III family protein [Bacillus fonticola]